MSQEKLEILGRQCMSKTFPEKGQIIAHEDQPITHVFFVKEGRLKLQTKVKYSKTNIWPTKTQ